MTPEEYYAQHQRAFRVAFNFLNAHFPPGDIDWWDASSADMLKASEGESQLACELLIGVWNYLDGEWKRRNLNGTAETGA